MERRGKTRRESKWEYLKKKRREKHGITQCVV
jgi:hypothetical protein